MLSPKQKEWLWQDCKKAKAYGDDIPTAKKRHSQPSTKPAKRLESAMASQKWQISSLTTQNKKLITTLIVSGIEIPYSDPSSDKDDGEDRKMVANKKIFNLTKTNKRKKSRAGWPKGTKCYMSCDRNAVAQVQTVKSTHSESNYNKISVELDSHAGTSVVGFNILVVHNHEHFFDVYGLVR